MTITNVSSNYLATAMLPAIKQGQMQLSTLQTEAATGEYADLGLQLGSQAGYELALRSHDDLLAAMTTANSITGANLDAAQSALSSVLSSADDAVKSLAGLSAGQSNAGAIKTLGASQLQQLVATGNTSAGGAYVFGGQNLGTPPLGDCFSAGSPAKTSVDNAFQSYFGFTARSSQTGSITPTQMQGFLTGPFAQLFQSSSWTQNWSSASDNNMTTQIAPNMTITSSTNANGSGFRTLAQAYTMLGAFGGVNLSADAQRTLVTTAMGVLNQGVSAVIGAQADLGQAQSQITSANSQMSDQMTFLQKQVSNLDSVDPARIAAELTQLSTQLQTSYQVTAKLHGLNLAQYLPA